MRDFRRPGGKSHVLLYHSTSENGSSCEGNVDPADLPTRGRAAAIVRCRGVCPVVAGTTFQRFFFSTQDASIGNPPGSPWRSLGFSLHKTPHTAPPAPRDRGGEAAAVAWRHDLGRVSLRVAGSVSLHRASLWHPGKRLAARRNDSDHWGAAKNL